MSSILTKLHLYIDINDNRYAIMEGDCGIRIKNLNGRENGMRITFKNFSYTSKTNFDTKEYEVNMKEFIGKVRLLIMQQSRILQSNITECLCFSE